MKKFLMLVLVAVTIGVTASIAQTIPAAVPAVSVAVPAVTPSTSTSFSEIFGILMSGVMTLGSVIFGIIKNSQNNTSQKVAQVAVKTIEWATSLPEVQAQEAKIKQQATAEATRLGVQDDLHSIVTQVTNVS